MKQIILIIIFISLSACGADDIPYKNSDDQSFYVPGYGTVNIHKGQPPNTAVLDYGILSEDIIVLSDLGFSIDYINSDGTTKWRTRTPNRGRGLHKWDANTISYTTDGYVFLLDINTGEEIDRFNPLGRNLNNFRKTDSGYIVAINSDGRNTVMLFDHSMNIIWSNPLIARYPRSVEKIGNIVIVADTFSHRIYGVDITTDEITFTNNEYYPGLVKQTNQGLLVVGEHSNRVYLLDVNNGNRTEIYTCQASPFDDIYISSDEIRALELDENHPLLLDPTNPMYSKSVCAQDLYSPNGASAGNFNTYFIASTDDGTVLEVDSFNNIIARLSGFNNPANVIPAN